MSIKFNEAPVKTEDNVDVNNLNEESLLDLIELKPEVVLELKEPTNKQLKTALKADPEVINLLPEKLQTDELRLFAIEQDTHVIEGMGTLSKTEQNAASQSKTASVDFMLNELLVKRKNEVIYESTFANLIDREPNVILALTMPSKNLLDRAIKNPKCDSDMWNKINTKFEMVKAVNNPKYGDDLKEKIDGKYKAEKQPEKKNTIKM